MDFYNCHQAALQSTKMLKGHTSDGWVVHEIKGHEQKKDKKSLFYLKSLDINQRSANFMCLKSNVGLGNIVPVRQEK